MFAKARAPLPFPMKEDFKEKSKTSLIKLRSNRREGPYQDAEEYRRIHIKLLTQDFLLTLNEQIHEFKETSRTTDRIFRVRFGPRRGKKKHIRNIKYDRKQLTSKDWEDDKRFMFGSMVIFFKSEDTCNEDFKVGIVSESPPWLEVQMMARDSDGFLYEEASSTFNGWFWMLDSQAFHFPYLHVIKALRTPTVPFAEELVYAKPKSPMAKYMETSLLTKHAAVTELLVAASRELNPSQVSALTSVLKHRVALVQGPPGTGKTHLGCKIVEFLVSMKRIRALHGPVMVVTTTNHAVDEFLKRCRKFSDKALQVASKRARCTHEDEGELQELYDNARNSKTKENIMKAADIIAMTTTKAALIRKNIELLNVTAVVVEEAAECLEGFIVASIPASAQHLILLGDHLQLRPQTHFTLASRYHLDESLLQRLVNNKFDCPMLLEQRRMKPEISKLVAHIYPKLTDHSSTKCRPNVEGIEKNLFFLTHDHKENKDSINPSFYNEHEANMVVKLCWYLLKRGHAADTITVLTTYKLQENLLDKKLSGSAIRVACVDAFQGEENKIIVLSLVRCNETGSIGFLAKENRTCVALSRARDGLFIFGSKSTLTESRAPVWTEVIKVLKSTNALGSSIPLICPHGRRFAGSSARAIAEATVGCKVCQAKTDLEKAESDLEKAESDLITAKQKVKDAVDLRTLMELKNKAKKVRERRDTAKKTYEMLLRQIKNGEINVHNGKIGDEMLAMFDGLTLTAKESSNVSRLKVNHRVYKSKCSKKYYFARKRVSD